MATVEQQPHAGCGGIAVENPATGEVDRDRPGRCPPTEVAALVARARAAQPGWEALGFEGRAKVLRRAQKWVVDNADRIVDDDRLRDRQDARRRAASTRSSTPRTRSASGPSTRARYLADEKVRSANPFVAGRKLVVRYRPLGVIGVIGPWNYPLTNSFGDCIPALAAGNAVVLKPSRGHAAHLAAASPRACASAACPRTSCWSPPATATTGAALVDEVDMVMFTGSTRTGKKIMERAAQTLTPVSLELGGKDPMIVLADADVERAANAAAYYSMQNGGQTCISVERVYVEAPVYDEFVDKLDAQGRRAAPGRLVRARAPSTSARSRSAPQLDIVDRHVEQARAAGARVLTGGAATASGGRFYEPTVLVDVDHTMACMTEETFGPTVPIMKVADADEAVRLANDSSTGSPRRSGRKDAARGEEIARRIEAGAVVRQRRPAQLPRARAADGRLEGVRPRLAPRRGRHPQVLPPAVAAGHALRAADGTCTSSRSGPRTTKLIGKAVKLLYGRGKRD